jgi:2-C-methyl-D-erythritol 4-phosphate cytidylyltransferase/2-C-methyl-D-erythritol 2,4-cyclodiphosphate synthase
MGSSAFDTRFGTGFAAARFCEGDRVTLCGIDIAHERGADSDVASLAIAEALAGALGPAGQASDLAAVAARIAAIGGRIVNVDVTVVCERPKVGPHREVMRRRLAELLALDIGRVSVKATTTEGLGFTGRREGLLAQAIASIELPRAQ